MSEVFYQEIPHTADWALRIWGATMPDLFLHAAEAMFVRMGADPAAPTRVQRSVTLDEAGGYEVLLVSWLNELIYLSEEHEEIYNRFTIDALTSGHLQATAFGNAGRPAGIKIKAATFYDVHIDQLPDRLETTLTFDV